MDGAPAVQNEGRPFAGGGASSGAVEQALAHLVAERTPFATYQVVTPKNCGDLDASAAWLFERGSRLLASTSAYCDSDRGPALG